MAWISRLLRRVYRSLLTLYPRDFREEWSPEIEETLKEGEDYAVGQGRASILIRFWWREFNALFRTAARLRWALSADAVFQDMKFGLRVLRRRPLFTLVAAGTMGLGIGSATAMFSVVNGVLLRPLPYENPGELVQVWLTIEEWKAFDSLGDRWDNVTIDWPIYERWRDGQTAFRDVAIYSEQVANLTGVGDPTQISAGFGTPSLLPLLGVRVALGRWFGEGEEGPDAAPVAVISHAFWQRQFGGDRDVLGMTVVVDDRSLPIIGVLPGGFGLGSVGGQRDGPSRSPDIWVPVGGLGQSMERGDFNFLALGRLRSGSSMEAAQPEAASLFLGDGQMGQFGARLQPRDEVERGGYRMPLYLLLGAASILLLIACGNLAILMTGEVTNRRQEVAARRALGAGGGRLLRQFLTESVLLGLAGSALGIVLAWILTGVVLRLAPPLPLGESSAMDRVVLLFAVGVGSAAGIIFGMVPALQAQRTSPQQVLRSGFSGEGKKEKAFQGFVVGGQMALTVVLLTSGLLLARSLGNLLSVDPGFDAEGLAEVRVQFPFFRYSDTHHRHLAIQGMFEAFAAIPGVEAVTGTNSLPFSGYTINTFPEVPGRTVAEGEQRPSARRRQVLPEYFPTLGVPVLSGRSLGRTDGEGAPGVVVVNQAMADRYWPGRSPLGEQLIHGDTFTVVGVAGNVLHASLDDEAYPTFYLPLAQSYQSRPPLEMSFVIRTHLPLQVISPRFREAVWSVDPNLPVSRISEASALVSGSTRDEEFRTALLSIFGLLATLLAGAGVFGVTARRVAKRRREMGICMALGANRSELIMAVMKKTAAPGLVGMGLGLMVALAVGSSLTGFLFDVEPWDPRSYLGAALLLGTVLVFAAFLPARTATATPPAEVLRQD